ncbi:hypothetical protein [Streptomyces sp. DH24]|uniref:hypothetical protein n=1 Tax=Streptomyces sp. DH24 TaxID=3040123 RepID=UPI0024426989|nr:hypothetical protein [Streptomyces sp. DH24]MDG9715723.1 hypothetical protein [Streptomyces sp. DH24]
MKYTVRPTAGGAAATVAAAALVLGGAGTASAAQPSPGPQRIASAQLQTHLTMAVELERTVTACPAGCAGQIV